MKTPNIFISHQWRYNTEYYSLKQKFIDLGWKHVDYSVPEHDPGDWNRVSQIKAGLEEQVRQCNFFIVFARMATLNSQWIQREVEYALKYDKYILGVRPWNYQGNIPFFIQTAANQIVGFNSPSIIEIVKSVLKD